jgi:hypothetical protein
MNECRIERVSRTLSIGAIHCPVGPDIIQLEVSVNSKLKDGPYPGHIGHYPVGGLSKT